MSIKDHVEFFLHPDRRPIRKEIYMSIVRSAEELKTAEQEGEDLKLLLARGKLLYHNIEGVFDDIQSEESSMAMLIGFDRAKLRKSNKG